MATGSVTGSATSQAQVTRARRGRRRRRPAPRSPAEDAADLVTGDAARRLGRRAGRDRHPRLRRVRAGAGRGVRPGRAGGPRPLRLRQPRGDHDLPRLHDRPAAAPRPADRPLRLHRQDRRPHAAAPGSAAPPATSPTSTRSRWTATLAQRLGWGERRVDLPAGRYDTILPPTAVADLMIDAYWYAGARVAHEGQSVYSRRGGGTRIGERHRPRRASASSPTRRTPGCECAPFAVAASSSNDEHRLRQRPAARAHRLDPRRRADLAAPDPALRRA